MKIALLRVAVDSAEGGIDGPLFKDNSFEYIPIPDARNLDRRTYGNTPGAHAKSLVDYFPEKRREKMRNVPIHYDPEFESFTYGDPTRPKAGLRRLEKGDRLLFYCGLTGWDHVCPPALYLFGYFVVSMAGYASDFSLSEVERHFSANWHVMHADDLRSLKAPDEKLVLVKGGPGSRRLEKACCISEMGKNKVGQPLKVLSKKMQKVFGDFDGRISIQRSPTRWITQEPWVSRTVDFVESRE